ncbi:molybdate ABC transporter substrate-binding protein [Cochlodiniinecator piscidefendens]|uniref:molybdate ABC transporter substrate-binding protein n=1 Tax=Cochlodiniinecator piscidefendens TaxID=2715756 RepID=UPI00140D398C|nr:molybdate ABC transporter substrate-binding protein [Cochlodiniinecator piscidefendens]
MSTILRISLSICAIVASSNCKAEEARVAVASNFQVTAQALIHQFEQQSDHNVSLIPGSSGRLYAQITHGAPFDVFLSADQLRPSLLLSEGYASQVKTYAVGEVVLAVSNPVETPDIADLLQQERIGIADASVAPYGAAALEVLASFNLHPDELNLVLGESITQVASFLSSGNIQVGFVARSLEIQGIDDQMFRYVPMSDRHSDIRQDAALISTSPAALDFYAFLSTPEAHEIIRDHGYRVYE